MARRSTSDVVIREGTNWAKIIGVIFLVMLFAPVLKSCGTMAAVNAANSVPHPPLPARATQDTTPTTAAASPDDVKATVRAYRVPGGDTSQIPKGAPRPTVPPRSLPSLPGDSLVGGSSGSGGVAGELGPVMRALGAGG